MIVIDSSLLLSVMLSEPNAAFAAQVVRRSALVGATAPALLSFELLNVLSVKLRRGLITVAERDLLLRDWPRYRVSLEPPPSVDVLLTAGRLAETHGLTGYDAAYLELALRRNAEVGTLDEPLARAAEACGLVVHFA